MLPVRSRVPGEMGATGARLGWKLACAILVLWVFLFRQQFGQLLERKASVSSVGAARRTASWDGPQRSRVRWQDLDIQTSLLRHPKVQVPVGTTRSCYSHMVELVKPICEHKLGWKFMRSPKEATLLFFKSKGKVPWTELEVWQRPSHLRYEGKISHKGHMLELLEAWHLKQGLTGLPFLPETYRLATEEGRKAFLARTEKGLDTAWITKIPYLDGGKGLALINTPQALTDLRGNLDQAARQSILAQRYIADPLLLGGKKFDLRIYWIVASVNPAPILLYLDGTLRVSLKPYHPPLQENGAEVLKHEHFTNAKQQKSDADYEKYKEGTRFDFTVLKRLLADKFPDHPVDPLDDVRCQIEHALAIVFHAAYDVLTARDPTADSFSLLGADFTIDNNLHLWVTEMQSGPGLPTNTNAANESIHSVVSEVMGIAAEVINLQAAGNWPSWPLKSVNLSEPFMVGGNWPEDVISPACRRIGRTPVPDLSGMRAALPQG